jgi:hypothetical protein
MAYFYGGTKVKYVGQANNLLDNKTVYTVNNFVDLRNNIVVLGNGMQVRGRLLVQLDLPNGKKTSYLSVQDLKRVQ